MGQAKRRGTFEERKAQAINKSKEPRKQKQKEYEDWWNSLTEEQREEIQRKEKKARERSILKRGIVFSCSLYDDLPRSF